MMAVDEEMTIHFLETRVLNETNKTNILIQKCVPIMKSMLNALFVIFKR